MANILFSGFALNNVGDAINNATVNLYTRNTTTPVLATTTTDANGYWTISYATQGRYDVEIVSGTTKRRRKYDDQVQLTTIEVGNFRIRNPANTFEYDIVPAAIVASRALNLPLLTAGGTIVCTPTVENINLGVGVAMNAPNYQFGRDADATNQMHFNVPTGATFELSVNDVPSVVVDSFSTEQRHTNNPYVLMSRTNAGVGGGDIGFLSFNALDSASNKTEYASISANSVVVTNGVEQGQLDFVAMDNAAVPRVMCSMRGDVLTPGTVGGMILGAPTGSYKGGGTINAKAVYDDNVILTGYVADVHQGQFNQAEWDNAVPNRIIPRGRNEPGPPTVEVRNHEPARAFALRAVRDLDPVLFAQDLMARGELPAMPTRAAWRTQGALSLGDLTQRLWETCEVQAIHIMKLSQRITALGG